MIKRYNINDISKIWTNKNKYKKMLKVELAILKALEERIIPKGISAEIHAKAKINIKRINEIEKIVKHDVIAFCNSITEQIEAKFSKYFHFGVTSSDITDSALSLQIKDSINYIIKDIERLCNSLLLKAKKTKYIVAMGRTHGMFAEPMSFGQKFLGSYVEFKRRLKDLKNFQKNDLTVQFSGAVGNYSILTTEDEQKAANILGLPVENVSTQIIPRDRIAKLISINGLIACAIERLSIEIRHLQSSDIFEVCENFTKNQQGSSTMPHKKNPISTENLTGLARILRSHVSISLENCIVWHERDISHSSVERLYLPDNFGIIVYSLRKIKDIIDNLIIKKDIIQNKIKNNNNYLSSFYLHFLILNTSFTRETCYKIIQKIIFNLKHGEFFYNKLQKIMKDKYNLNLKIPKLDFNDIKQIYLKEIEHIFNRSEKL